MPSYPLPKFHFQVQWGGARIGFTEVTGLDEQIEAIEYREVCWDLNERGAVGETILHLCLLNATSTHADLAKRLLNFYPKLINDVYISDEYYGKHLNFN